MHILQWTVYYDGYKEIPNLGLTPIPIINQIPPTRVNICALDIYMHIPTFLTLTGWLHGRVGLCRSYVWRSGTAPRWEIQFQCRMSTWCTRRVVWRPWTGASWLIATELNIGLAASKASYVHYSLITNASFFSFLVYLPHETHRNLWPARSEQRCWAARFRRREACRFTASTTTTPHDFGIACTQGWDIAYTFSMTLPIFLANCWSWRCSLVSRVMSKAVSTYFCGYSCGRYTEQKNERSCKMVKYDGIG